MIIAAEIVNPCVTWGLEPGSWAWILMGCDLYKIGLFQALPLIGATVIAIVAARRLPARKVAR